MKKILIKSICTLGFLTMLLAGCSSKKETRDVASQDSTPTEPVTTNTEVQEIQATDRPVYLGASSGGRAL